MSALKAHLARLGGALIRPGPTLERLLYSNEGRMYEIFPWMLVLTAAIDPVRTGRAFLMARVEPLTGLRDLLLVVSNRMTIQLVVLVAGAAVLFLAQRLLGHQKDRQELGFDRALDLMAVVLVPHLFLAAVGQISRSLGWELQYFPHRRLYFYDMDFPLKLLFAWGWSSVLYISALRHLWKGRAQEVSENS